MAESASGGTSIGKISLDLEMGGNLKDQMQEMTKNLQKQLAQSMQQPIKSLFEDMAKTMIDSLKSITDEVRNMMAASKKELENYLKQINSVKMPVMPAQGDTTQPSQNSDGSIAARAPPAAISFPKIKINYGIEQQKELINSQLVQIEAQMDRLKSKSNELEDAMQKALRTDPAGAEVYESQLKQVGAQMVDLEIKAEALNSKFKELTVVPDIKTENMFSGKTLGTIPTSDLDLMKNSLREIWSYSLKMHPALEMLANGMRNVGNASKVIIQTGSKAVLSGFISSLKQMTRLLPKCVQKLLPFNKNLKDSGKHASSSRFSFKRLLGTLVVFRLIMPAITKAIRSMFTSLVQSLKTNDQFAKSLNQIKSNMSVAFTPIFQAILPAINALMSALSKVTAYIAAFTSTLFGSSLSASVAATKRLNDQKKALGGVGKAAEDAKLQIASFDQLNVIGNRDDGSGESGTEITMPDVNTSGISDFAQKLRDLIQNDQWYDVGALFGEKLSESLDQINWAPIQAKAASIGKNLADLINGFVEFPDLGLKIGENIGEALNTALALAHGFITNLHWDSIGKSIGEGFAGLFRKFNWGQLGGTIGTFVGGIWQMIGNAIIHADLASLGSGFSTFIITMLDTFCQKVLETDWIAVGEALAKGLIAIDWAGILVSVAKAIFIGLGVACTILVSMLGEIGSNIVKGLYDGIVTGLSNIGKWLKENLVDPLVDGVRDLLGIHSPSTVFAEIGSNIIMGLFEGLKGLWDTVSGWFHTKFDEICIWIQIKWDGIVGFFDRTVSGIGGFFGRLADDISNGFKTGINWAIDNVNKFIGWLNDKLRFSWDPLYILGQKIYDGGSVQLVTIPSIPRLAQGGVIDQPTLAMFGEDGAEAVVPLKNNTEWAGSVADLISERLNNTGTADLDEVKSLLKTVIDLLQILTEKEYGITEDTIGRTSEKYLKDKQRRIGKPVLTY